MRPKRSKNKNKRKDLIRNELLVLDAVKSFSGARLSATSIRTLIEHKFNVQTVNKHLRNLEAKGQIERIGNLSDSRGFIINYIGARDESLQSSQA
jgi:DNA-binding MarR family transcriptional regulator